MNFVRRLADCMVLGSLLDLLRRECGSFDFVDHWQQGEFHHDVVFRMRVSAALPGPILVVATNCNGGVKEVFCFASMPERYGLWRLRCPTHVEFVGAVPEVLARETTPHWFDPCELLRPDARSELRREHRERQFGGGWQRKA